MKHLSRLSLLFVLLASLILGACGSVPTDAPTAAPVVEPTAEPIAEPIQEPVAVEPEGITVVDALGRTVELDALPQRVLVAGQRNVLMVETAYLFPEAVDRVMGVAAGKQSPKAFLSLVDPDFEAKMVLMADAGPEQIAPLNPDLVLLRPFTADKLGTPLEDLGIPVVYLDLETPEQYFRDLMTLGQIFGNEARAAEIQEYYQARLDAIAEAVEGSSEAKPSVLLLQYNEEGGEVAFEVPSASWIQTAEVELAGGDPVWKDAATAGGWTVVNLEQIAAWNPDKVFVIHYQIDGREIVDKLVADPQWQALKAVQNGEIYGFPGDALTWDQPDPRWILGVTWLAGKIHPTLFPDLDMEQEAKGFFVDVYGIDAATVDSQILPNLKGHVQ